MQLAAHLWRTDPDLKRSQQEVLANPELAQQDIADFRRVAGLPKYVAKDGEYTKTVAVAYGEDGTMYFGLSSQWSKQWNDRRRGLCERMGIRYLHRMDEQDSYVKHAEAMALMQYVDAVGGDVRGRIIVLVVDREPCDSCYDQVTDTGGLKDMEQEFGCKLVILNDVSGLPYNR